MLSILPITNESQVQRRETLRSRWGKVQEIIELVPKTLMIDDLLLLYKPTKVHVISPSSARDFKISLYSSSSFIVILFKRR